MFDQLMNDVVPHVNIEALSDTSLILRTNSFKEEPRDISSTGLELTLNGPLYLDNTTLYKYTVDGNALLIWAVTEHLGFLMNGRIVLRIAEPIFLLCFYNLPSYTFTLDACGNNSNAVVVGMFACVPLPPSISFFLIVFSLADVFRGTSQW